MKHIPRIKLSEVVIQYLQIVQRPGRFSPSVDVAAAGFEVVTPAGGHLASASELIVAGEPAEVDLHRPHAPIEFFAISPWRFRLKPLSPSLKLISSWVFQRFTSGLLPAGLLPSPEASFAAVRFRLRFCLGFVDTTAAGFGRKLGIAAGITDLVDHGFGGSAEGYSSSSHSNSHVVSEYTCVNHKDAGNQGDEGSAPLRYRRATYVTCGYLLWPSLRSGKDDSKAPTQIQRPKHPPPLDTSQGQSSVQDAENPQHFHSTSSVCPPCDFCFAFEDAGFCSEEQIASRIFRWWRFCSLLILMELSPWPGTRCQAVIPIITRRRSLQSLIMRARPASISPTYANKDFKSFARSIWDEEMKSQRRISPLDGSFNSRISDENSNLTGLAQSRRLQLFNLTALPLPRLFVLSFDLLGLYSFRYGGCGEIFLSFEPFIRLNSNFMVLLPKACGLNDKFRPIMLGNFLSRVRKGDPLSPLYLVLPRFSRKVYLSRWSPVALPFPPRELLFPDSPPLRGRRAHKVNPLYYTASSTGLPEISILPFRRRFDHLGSLKVAILMDVSDERVCPIRLLADISIFTFLRATSDVVRYVWKTFIPPADLRQAFSGRIPIERLLIRRDSPWPQNALVVTT
ncbi:hypothetical protein FNV43_RR11054 [Rhamnella rubrinervis]|uniref:Uncharacterized protein n=1 Tax=Rhamnella rubrinervis TaxID=2594499 RepID=A0A8K0H4W0_9ROSA|nr:hypothetical protein FNV43_RR11054 [Rhamnella rubrinervis]